MLILMFGMRNVVSCRKKIEDVELQALLDEDVSQTQRQMSDRLSVSQKSIANRLQATGKILKVVLWNVNGRNTTMWFSSIVNAPSHRAKSAKAMIDLLSWELHLAYSSDLTPSDYHSFASIGQAFSEQHFQSYEALVNWLNDWFSRQRTRFFFTGEFKNCLRAREKCGHFE